MGRAKKYPELTKKQMAKLQADANRALNAAMKAERDAEKAAKKAAKEAKKAEKEAAKANAPKRKRGRPKKVKTASESSNSYASKLAQQRLKPLPPRPKGRPRKNYEPKPKNIGYHMTIGKNERIYYFYNGKRIKESEFDKNA
jgi:hypothetical protein